jgi:hypothetical protein
MGWTNDDEKFLREAWATATSTRDIALSLDRSPEAVARKAGRLGLTPRGGDPAPKPTATAPLRTEAADVSLDEERGEGRVFLQSTERIRTAEEAMQKAGVDPSQWLVAKQSFKSYEAMHKDEKGNAIVTPLWSVHLDIKRRAGWTPEEFRREIVDALRDKRIPRTSTAARRPPAKGLLAEVSIMDHHFGKLAWAPETGEDYDLKIADERYRAATEQLLATTAANKPDRVLWVVGNDFYHVDSGNNTTTRGTPQDCDGRWQKAFVVGVRATVDGINAAREIAPVDVMVVPGNHDEERAFTLGVILEELYFKDTRVAVHNSPDLKKSFVWGKTFLGFYHGHDSRTVKQEREVIDALASQDPQAWAGAVWRELHLGHLHHEREEVWHYRSSQDLDRVIVRRLPSLSATDRWHHHNGFRSLKAAEAHFYRDTCGRVGYAVANPYPVLVS